MPCHDIQSNCALALKVFSTMHFLFIPDHKIGLCASFGNGFTMGLIDNFAFLCIIPILYIALLG